MDYKDLFRQKALENFDLNANDYFVPFDIEQFILECDSICKNANEQYVPKQAIKKLTKLYNHYLNICENPTALTEQEEIDMLSMKEYLTKNRGHINGYFPYRKQFYEEEVGKLYELSLTNKMYILANQDFIFTEIQNKIIFMQECDYQNTYIKHKIITPKIRLIKRNWAKQKTLCVCGKEYNKSGKTQHFKSKHHIQFIHDNTQVQNNNNTNIYLHISEKSPI